MTVPKINPRFGVLALIMLTVAAMRIPNAAQLTPWSNFTPVGAMSLFGGIYFSRRWKAALFPLLTLLASDLVINLLVYHGRFGVMYSGWYWIYGIFVLISFLGNRLVQTVTAGRVLAAALTASLVYWLLADFSVWAGGGIDLRTMQPLSRDAAGLLQCYQQGMPYALRFLAGTLVYSAIMFGLFEWTKAKRARTQLTSV